MMNLVHTLRASGFDASEDGTGRGIAGGGKPGQGYPAIRDGTSVRRLTPTECERLQAFPEGFTCLEVAFAADDRLFRSVARFPDGEPYSTARCRCPDGPRYAALGNAVTVNVIEWIGRRIFAADGHVAFRAT